MTPIFLYPVSIQHFSLNNAFITAPTFYFVFFLPLSHIHYFYLSWHTNIKIPTQPLRSFNLFSQRNHTYLPLQQSLLYFYSIYTYCSLRRLHTFTKARARVTIKQNKHMFRESGEEGITEIFHTQIFNGVSSFKCHEMLSRVGGWKVILIQTNSKINFKKLVWFK